MRKIFLLLTLLISVVFTQAQNVAGNELRIYKNAQIGEDGNATINMHSNRVQGVADPINLLDAVNKQWFMSNMSLTQPIDSLSLTPLTDSDIQTDYTMYADSLSYGGAFKTGLGSYIYKLGQATVLLYYNDNAYAIEPFDVLHLKGGALVNGQLYPTPELADASDWEKTQGTLSIAAHAIAPGEFGFTVLYGVIKGGSTLGLTAGEQMWLSDDGTGDLTTTRPEFQSYSISTGGVFNSVAAPDGQIFVNITRDIYDTFNDGWDGSIRETFDFRVTSDGATITGTLENVINTNDLTLLFSDGFNTFDTTDPAATLSLVAGTTTAPQLNYIFIDKATKTLQTSTGGFPVLEHAKIAVVGVLDALTTQNDGALRNQNTNDHIKKENDNGHVLHIAERIRQLNAEWDSGAETTLSGTPTNVYFANTSGKVWQMHLQDFPAQDMAIGDDIHVVNDPVTAYRTTTNLNDITVFSDGTSWNNEWSNLVVWGVGNKTGEVSHLMVNLPSDGYTSESDAFNDNENFTDYTIPKDFKGVGFLLGRFTIRRSGANFTYNLSAGYLDLRGFVPNNTAGSGGGGPSGITEFTSLTDTPNSYIGFSGQATTVTALEDGLEFTPVVTSINGQSPTSGNYNITSTANKIGEDVTIGTGGTGEDAVFSVADNDADPTNENQDLSNSKLNSTVTVNITNGVGTTITEIARTDFANDYSAFQTFSGGASSSTGATTAYGLNAASGASGVNYTAFGDGAGDAGNNNNNWDAHGHNAGGANATGGLWGAFGSFAGESNTSGSSWLAMGATSGRNNTGGSGWITIGTQAGLSLFGGGDATSFDNSVYIGFNTTVSGNGVTNENVFGYDARGRGSNTISIGNASITDNYFTGDGHFEGGELNVTDAIGRLDIKSTALLAQPINEVRFLDANGIEAQFIQGGNGSDNNLRIGNEKGNIELYHLGSDPGDLRLSTTAAGIDVNGNVDADSYSVGGTEVIDASRNINAATTTLKALAENDDVLRLNSFGSDLRAFSIGFEGVNAEDVGFYRIISNIPEKFMNINRSTGFPIDFLYEITGTEGTFSADLNCVDLNYSGSLVPTSDIRVKDSIQSLIFENNKYLQLNPVGFYYKYDSTKTIHGSFLAQELELLYPNLVKHSKTHVVVDSVITQISSLDSIAQLNIKDEDRLHTIDPMSIIPLNTLATQKALIKCDSLQIIVDENKLQIEILKSLNKNLDDRLKAIEN
jgi:hypothetical protein